MSPRDAGRQVLEDVDTGARAQRTQMAAWSSLIGVFGIAVGLLLTGLREGDAAYYYPIIGGLAGFAAYGILRWFTEGVGRTASGLLEPSSGKRQEGHSLADSLVARGRYREALDVLEARLLEEPDDQRAHFLTATILKDHLNDVVGAERALKRARREAALSHSQERFVCRTLVELHRKTGTPARAAPELARLAELAAGTEEGAWARAELASLKEGLARSFEAFSPPDAASSSESPS